MKIDIRGIIAEHASVISKLEGLTGKIDQCIEKILLTYKHKGKILVCGNGGSAADAQHFAAELTGRYLGDRRAYAAISLTTDTSALTSISNDYGYDQVFRRQLEAVGNTGDMLFAISTSGNSGNIVQAVEYARDHGVYTVGLLGKDGGKLNALVDLPLVVPSNHTARIQEAHILILHILCEALEA